MRKKTVPPRGTLGSTWTAGRPYVLATQFYREPHLPVRELKRDMKRIKAIGLNTLKIQEAWSYDEPAEGAYDFRLMDELAQEAGRAGLNVFFTLCMEVPAWAWKKFPDALRITEEGRPLFSYNGYGYTDGKPGPCWNHPGMRGAMRRFLAAFATHLGRHANVVMWQAYQELNWWRTQVECFCPVCRGLYQGWLKKRYGTLRALEAAWMIPHGAWDEIEPPRQRSGPSYADWWRFSREQAGLMLQDRADTLRANDPGHRPVSVNVSNPHLGQEWDWMLAEHSDIQGASFYPAYFHTPPIPAMAADRRPDARTQLPHDMWHTCLWYDAIRVASRGRPWASEFQAGPAGSNLYHGPDPTPGEMRRWLLLALSAGVKGIAFWNHRPEFYGGEAHRYGIFGEDMAPTAKTREMAAIAAAVTKRQALFESGRLADVNVAILVNDDTARHLDMHQAGGLEVKAVQGLYRTLWNMGMAVDFLAPVDLVSGRLNRYRAAILPLPLALSSRYAELLKAYVRQGGVLISEACPGRYSDRDMANLGTGFSPGLDELFGCCEEGVRMVVEQDGSCYNQGMGQSVWHGAYAGPLHLEGIGDFKGARLPASLYVETFRPSSGTPIFRHGDKAAGVVHACGKGRAYLLGTFPSLAMMHVAGDRGLEKTLRVIFRREAIPDSRCGKLILRRLEGDGGIVWFFINPTDRSVTRPVPSGLSARGTDLIDGTRLGGRLTVEAFSIRAVVEPAS